MALGPRPEPRERILTRTDPPARQVPHRPPPVVVAADIGGAAVLKSGRRFLLSDDLGDVHPDARGLGLYLGDTRVLSRLGGRPCGPGPSRVVARGDVRAGGRWTLGSRPGWATGAGQALSARSARRSR